MLRLLDDGCRSLDSGDVLLDDSGGFPREEGLSEVKDGPPLGPNVFAETGIYIAMVLFPPKLKFGMLLDLSGVFRSCRASRMPRGEL